MPLRQMLRYAGLVREGDATLAERRAMLEAHERQVRATILPMGVIISPPRIAWIRPSSTNLA